ncbi:hypothetical protein D3C84_1234470 [compost metagenome]
MAHAHFRILNWLLSVEPKKQTKENWLRDVSACGGSLASICTKRYELAMRKATVMVAA